MEKISIIVPIYNSERYLEHCLESLVNQTYFNVEIVLVNDGSTDRTFKICRDYESRYPNIKYVEIKNGGRVRARKIGIQNATGRYVTFVDSDDWIERNTIECMYKRLCTCGADIVIMGYFENFPRQERTLANNLPKGVYCGEKLEEIFSAMLCKDNFFSFGIAPFLVNKLYKREVIEPYILKVNEEIIIGEDVLSVYPAILSSKCVCITDEAYYHYRMHENSTMHSYRSSNEEYKNIELQYNYLKPIFEKHVMKDALLKQLDRYIMHHQMVRCLSYFNKIMNKGSCYPFQYMRDGSDVIIYGAGAFGVAAYQFFVLSDRYNVVGWCDRDYEKYQSLKYMVEDLNIILDREFDYIIIAVMNESTTNAIKKNLLELKIDAPKLIWLDTKLICKADGGYKNE